MSYGVEEDKKGKYGKLVPIDRLDKEKISGNDYINTFELKKKMSEIVENQDAFNTHDSKILNETNLWV
jgi:hypothetical protein